MAIRDNLNTVKDRIKEACERASRNSNEVKLVAVSKFHPAESVVEAIQCGQFLFGENRVQEAKAKFEQVRQEYPEAKLHIIGSLQRNKVKDAVKICECIESVDRIELLDEIEKQCAKINKKIDVLFELHTGEESKSGFPDFDSLKYAVELCKEGKYPHVNPKGFMTMAPFTEDKQLIRKSFSTLRKCSDQLKKEYTQFDLCELSMGMSNDFEIAIEEGSTMIRVGTSIFGKRNYN
ncbi:MAG: YggS family pyridoxal phosphate-dependent enzyme [Treponema sp.]|uniref:YggS family pyridoxal phosphate-dependent enzyme n=1 Tax=Treponema sp. TaxID=166 RepID=UPI00298E7112|nr:YggS family pyridoxal phosphate-dependent enzyme [Treponema sp.]MBR5934435.1 YggS family pyridoxal phosphate-dependent enzyme [Treponema sp.]